ncbi:hypothetical protein DMA15_03865 [Streptomyces sp. WAC 01529]|uniref:hypothetical protein n=1 Tax=Streptomyces sp. WAC 01529 TaxID=2203205 RepID=UPI000F6E21EB|nr:hypothetical protein [Streptomyces sp. WAC 01529]AZM51830.1 hypothetical protein DMA15_03865 [Streptomyces sp. WAC 01529]
MSEQYPVSGGKMVISPDGTSTYVRFYDRPQTADETKAFAKYADLSPLEILRRLRVAEWNADVCQRERDRWRVETQRLQGELAAAERKLAAYPPDGYELPKVVADLLAHTTAHGWKTAVAWTLRVEGGAYVDVRLGRLADPAEARFPGARWEYQMTWGFPGPGARGARVRTSLAKTPDSAQWRDAPSLKKIREVIAANPMPRTDAP